MELEYFRINFSVGGTKRAAPFKIYVCRDIHSYERISFLYFLGVTCIYSINFFEKYDDVQKLHSPAISWTDISEFFKSSQAFCIRCFDMYFMGLNPVYSLNIW